MFKKLCVKRCVVASFKSESNQGLDTIKDKAKSKMSTSSVAIPDPLLNVDDTARSTSRFPSTSLPILHLLYSIYTCCSRWVFASYQQSLDTSHRDALTMPK